MPESELNHYGRTHELEHNSELVPLIFKATREGTFENFEDCYIKLKIDSTPALKVLDQDAKDKMAKFFSLQIDSEFFEVFR